MDQNHDKYPSMEINVIIYILTKYNTKQKFYHCQYLFQCKFRCYENYLTKYASERLDNKS